MFPEGPFENTTKNWHAKKHMFYDTKRFSDQPCFHKTACLSSAFGPFGTWESWGTGSASGLECCASVVLVCLFVCVFVCLFARLLVDPFVCCLFGCLFVCSSACLFCWFACLCVCLFARLFVCSFVS